MPDSVKIKIEPRSPIDDGDETEGNACDITNASSTDEQNKAKSNQPSIHASVRRARISATTVQEGDEELQDLDIEVYDQQTYERGVFDQVDEAISVADAALAGCDKIASTDSNKNNQFNNLIQLIHDQNEQSKDKGENCDTSNNDEDIIRLARSQRLNQVSEKQKLPSSSRVDDSIKNLPKIPRKVVSFATIKVEPQNLSETEVDRPTTPICDEETNEEDYQPYAENHSDEDEEYETDSEIDQNLHSDTSGDETQDTTRRDSKKLRDDGDTKFYLERIKAYNKKRAKLRIQNISEEGVEELKIDETICIDGDLVIPKSMWDDLFDHQRIGVKWLWELHQLGTGGILGDEMGLGKTIQMIAFLTALKCSLINNIDRHYEGLGPTVLVCPATVMHQWLAELRKWWPPFRVGILHNTGSFGGNKATLVRSINKARGILIVSYPGVVIYQEHLHSYDWHYAILDEGHKIRNPDAQVTLACKRFRTSHRIILSGSPVQNNLKELWSIFDFIYPGKLGTLPVFMEQFGIPITQGGYANATDIQVQIAYKCSCVLRDTIKPFLLRRTKSEVNNKLKLPERSEQVLFCKLTDRQRKFYQAYLESPTVRDIKSGFCQIFVGLIELRKICNHPDLFDTSECQKQLRQIESQATIKHKEFFSENETYGHYKKSGKMMVVDALLKLWKKQNHKVLLFTQSRQMIKIFASYLKDREYHHLSMDGSTPIGIRQGLIEQFNKDDGIFVFLLTTRVGGVGINLIGANRIIIYDPDWNPSTDIQARERAWRIGQQRHVIIYRLLTAGTIEEKIYHRQVFKLYLTNRVLKDVKQKRFFKTNDLHELFTLGHNDQDIETKALFDEDLHIRPESLKRKKSSKHSKKKSKSSSIDRKSEMSLKLTDEKLRAMRERAKLLSKMITQQYGETSTQSADNNKDGTALKTDSETERLEGCTMYTPFTKPPPDREHNEFSAEEEGAKSRKKKSGKHDSKSKRHIEFLVRQDIYKQNDKSDCQDDRKSQQEDYILGRLFKNANIAGALKHDRIETDSTADFKVVESEAEKVARDAIRALRESRRLCLDSSIGMPNWTGRNGHVAPAPKSGLMKRRRGPVQLIGRPSSSSDQETLLSSIKKRTQLNPISLAQSSLNPNEAGDEEARNRDFLGKSEGTGAEQIADKLRDYLLFQSTRRGEAQTDELLSFFNENFKPEKTPIFKAILYKMCEFQRRGDKGFWLIKNEFRDL